MNIAKFAAHVAAIALVLPLQCLAQSAIAVSPKDGVGGMSQEDWSKAWWQWAASFDGPDSPVADRTGVNCHLKQSGAVWFLAGTYGTQRTIRTCKIPRDKFLFFPIINYVVAPGSGETCEHCCPTYKATAKSITESPSMLLVELDGNRLESVGQYRQETAQCFDLGAMARPAYRIFPSAANGYYIMLKPLRPGKHVLNFGGVLPEMSQAVTYTLLVE